MKEFVRDGLRFRILEHRRVDGADFPRPDPSMIAEQFVIDVTLASDDSPIDLYPNQNPHPHSTTPNRLTIYWAGPKVIRRGSVTKRGADFRARFWPSVMHRVGKAQIAAQRGVPIWRVTEALIDESPESLRNRLATSADSELARKSLDDAILELTGDAPKTGRRLSRGTVANIDTAFDADVTDGNVKTTAGSTVRVGSPTGAQGLRAAWRFSLATLPAGATVNDVDFQFNVDTANGAGGNANINAYDGDGQGDPNADSGSVMRAACVGTTYLATSTMNTTGSKTVDLTSTADAHVAAAIAGGIYTVAAASASFGAFGQAAIQSIENAGTDPATLIVDYTEPGPIIDDVTPDEVQDGTTVVIEGENFGASQGSGKVEIGDDSDYGMANLEEATVSAWADDEITADIVQGSLANGPVWLFVTDDDGNTSDGFAMTIGILDFSIEGTIDLELEVESPVAVSLHHVGTIDLEIDFAELPAPPVLDFAFTGSIDLELEPEAGVRTFSRHAPGESTVTVYNPAGVSQGTLTPLRYRLSRYENQVGDWECEIPIDEEIDDDDIPLARKITYGWKISIHQENFNPDHAPEEGFLLYQGIVEDRDFKITEGGAASLAMKGSRRTYEIVRRSVLRNYEFDDDLLTLTTNLVGSLAGGPILYDSARLARTNLKGSFTDLSKYAAWVKGALLGRHVIRESWDHDRPEIVPYDGPPNSGITFRPANSSESGGTAAAIAARYAHENGGSGVALIAGKPVVRYLGANVVNRIIAKGIDTIEDPEDPESTISADLTLQHASLSSPYTVKAGANPDGTLYYYIEDEDSIEAYGLTEVVLTFSEVKNPNDDSVSRTKAANVLYMKAVNEMIKRRSETLEVSLPPLANGAQIWALPGDQCVFQYTGEAQTVGGTATWIDEDRRMLITERHEESHGSGVRRVGYVLKAPVMEFPVPGLPDEISLPPPDGGDPGDPGTPDAPGSEPCCEDPNTGEEEGPEDEWEDNFPPPQPIFFQLGAFAVPTLSLGFSALWHFEISDPLDMVSVPPSITEVPLEDLGPGTWTVTARVSLRADAFGVGTCTYEVAILGIGGSLGEIPYAGVSVTMNPGEVGTQGGIVPVVGAQFENGEHTSIRVRVFRTAGPNLISMYNPTEDSWVKVSFVAD